MSAALLLLVAGPRLAAQAGQPTQGAPAESRRWGAVELWGGLATDSPSWGVLGEAPSMDFGVLGLRFSRALGAAGPVRASRLTEFTVDLIPLATMSPPFISLRGTGVRCAAGALCVVPPTFAGRGLFPHGSAYGFGLNPAGVTTRFRADRHFSPSLGFAVGGLWFDRQVPTTRASRFNFTAALEAGLRLGAPARPGITVTYRFHHLSNAGTAGENPGLASHLFTAGFHHPRSRAAR